MKILIAYTSRTGTAAQCAAMLCERLEAKHEVVLWDMRKGEKHSPADFDAVVLGSSVRMGKISKELRGYIKENLAILCAKPCAVFLCCGFPDEFEEYVRSEFPKEFKASYGFYCFGGELKPQKVKGIDKLLVRAIRKSITEHDFEDGNYKGSLPEIIPEHIEILADKIMNK